MVLNINSSMVSNRTVINEEKSLTFTVLLMTAAGTLSLTTMLGNLLIVFAYYDNKRIRSLTNIPLVSLAITDMFIGFYPMNMNVLEMAMGYWPFGKVMCNISLILDYVSVQSSINHIVLINFDRHYSIKHPLKHRTDKKKSRVCLKLFCGWLFAFLLWAPYISFYEYTVRKKMVPATTCYKKFSEIDDVSFKAYFLVLTSVLGYFIPLSIVLIVYIKMYLLIRQQLLETLNFNADSVGFDTPQCYTVPLRSEALQQENDQQKRKIEMLRKRKIVLVQKKSLRMIASIVLAFVITGLPLNTQWLLGTFCHVCYNQLVFDISNFITYPNSTINPFLYAFVNRSFRAQLKKFIMCRFTWHAKSKLNQRKNFGFDANIKEDFSVSEFL